MTHLLRDKEYKTPCLLSSSVGDVEPRVPFGTSLAEGEGMVHPQYFEQHSCYILLPYCLAYADECFRYKARGACLKSRLQALLLPKCQAYWLFPQGVKSNEPFRELLLASTMLNQDIFFFATWLFNDAKKCDTFCSPYLGTAPLPQGRFVALGYRHASIWAH